MTASTPANASEATGPLWVETVTDLDAARALIPQWNALVVATSAQPTMLAGYALSWWEHVGSGSLRLLVARRGNEVVGVAPLHQRSTLGVQFVRWLGHGTGVVGHVVAHPQDQLVKAALWEAVVHRTSAFDLAGTEREEIEHIHLDHEVLYSDKCPTAAFEPGWEIGDYLASRQRKRARRELSRTDRRLSEGNAEFSLRRASAWDDVQALLPDLVEVYDAAEADRERLHLLRGDFEVFFRQFLRAAADDGLLDVFVGYVNAKPAAFDVLVTVGSVSHTILGRYHPDARDWGVGHPLMRAMAEAALERGSATFNLQIGNDEYKRAWTDGEEANREVVDLAGSTHGSAFTRIIKLRYQAYETLHGEVRPRLERLRNLRS